MVEGCESGVSCEVEIELKLLIHARHLNKLKRHPLLRRTKEGRRFVTRHLRSIYFDTPNLQLAGQGMALRLRKNGHDGWEQTLKASLKAQSALPERREITVTLPNDQMDLDRFEGQPVPDGFHDEKFRKRLGRVFETNVTRSMVDLAYRGAGIELACDHGDIRSGDKVEPIAELELELKHGNPLALFDWALEVQRDIPVRLFTRSKAARGKALFTGKKTTYAKAKSANLRPGMSAQSAFQAILDQGLIQMLGNEHCVVQDLHHEGTHQMRVALRRIRTCFNLFDIPAGEADELKNLLRWLTKSLDALRDWDVFLNETLPPVEAFFAKEPGLDALRKAAQHHRADALKAARSALDHDNYARLGLLLGAWASHTRWANGAVPEQMAAMLAPVEETANRLLASSYKRMVRTGKRLSALTIPELHAWRLKVKRLRYACDFFGDVYAGKSVQKFRTGLTGIQDVLGQLNDAEVARVRMAALSHELSPAGTHAAGLVAGWHGKAAEARLGDIQEAWNSFARQTPFWER